MANPHDVLAQLLSEQQADSLTAIAGSSWLAMTRVLSALLDGAPSLEATDARLVMPDEIVGDYRNRHLVVPVDLTTDLDQNATAYAIFPTEAVAAFFDVSSEDPAVEEQQAMIVGSTIANQIIQGLSANVFGDSPAGLTLRMGEITANTMIETLEAMDEPALALAVRLGGATQLTLSLVLPGTFLDIIAGSLPAIGSSNSDVTSGLSFALTEDDLDAAELVDLPPLQAGRYAEPVGATAGLRAGMQATANHDLPLETPNTPAMAGGLPPRQPTPISNAPTAQRARFAPLPDGDPPVSRGNLDLLSALQMNVTVELGRTELTVAEVLGLGPGSVVELDRLAGEPVDILVNDRIIARGEVVVVDENFGVRVVEVVGRSIESEERAG